MTRIFITLLAITLITFTTKADSNSIVGTFYSALYLLDDFNDDLILKKEIPTIFSDIYKKEEDVDWKLEFLKNGKIKFTDLGLYYCGNERTIIKNGKWKKISDKVFEIEFEGATYKNFTIKNKYTMEDLENGDKRLKLEKD